MRSTTARDVADRLQIAVSTVGRALADDPRIGATTKQRVREAAAEMGYVVNRAAQMMRGAGSNLVGLVVPDIRNHFYATMAHAIAKCLEQGGFQLTLSATDDDRMLELQHLQALAGAKVAGVMIIPTVKPHAESIKLLSAMRHIQLVRQHQALGEQWFGIDDEQALRHSTQHLLDLGHQRIAYVGGPTGLLTAAARLEGFRGTLKGTAAEALAIEHIGPPSDIETGRAALRQLLALAKPPTALVLGSVQITLGVLEEASQLGVRVPEQLSLVGFGDEPAFRWWGPGLTTLAMPTTQLATACGLWFLHQLKTGAAMGVPHRSISPVELVPRGSTRRIGPATTRPAYRSNRRHA